MTFYVVLVGAFFNPISLSSVLAGGQSMAEVWGWVQCSWGQLCVRGSGSSEHRPFYYSSPRARVHSCGLELDCIILLTYPELQSSSARCRIWTGECCCTGTGLFVSYLQGFVRVCSGLLPKIWILHTVLGGQQFWNYAKVIKQRTVKHKRWSEPAGWFNW